MPGGDLCSQGMSAGVARGAEPRRFAEIVGANQEFSAIGECAGRRFDDEIDKRVAADGIDGEDAADELTGAGVQRVG